MLPPIQKISIMGCGWLGLPLGKSLVEAGFEVHGSTTTRSKLPDLRRAGTIGHLIEVKDQLEGDLDGFFDTDLLLLNIPPGRRRPDVEQRYPEQIREVVSWAQQAGTRRLMFVSSTSVYPDRNKTVDESDEIEAESGSGLALVRCEEYLRSETSLPLTILRPGGLAGGDRNPGRFLAGKKDLRNGGAPVNMIHLADCIGIIQQLIQQDRNGEVFNLVADEHPSRAQFYRHQALKSGLEPPSFADEQATHYKVVANEKIKKRLGYRFQYPDPMDF